MTGRILEPFQPFSSGRLAMTLPETYVMSLPLHALYRRSGAQVSVAACSVLQALMLPTWQTRRGDMPEQRLRTFGCGCGLSPSSAIVVTRQALSVIGNRL